MLLIVVGVRMAPKLPLDVFPNSRRRTSKFKRSAGCPPRGRGLVTVPLRKQPQGTAASRTIRSKSVLGCRRSS